MGRSPVSWRDGIGRQAAVHPIPAIRSRGYFGPEAPEGFENNWVKTNEGDGFFVFFRFYSPTEAYYDKSWQLPMVEKLE